MVDIDNDRITIPEDLPSFPQHKELADELREVLTKLQQTPTTTHSSSSSYNKQAPNTNIQSSSSYERIIFLIVFFSSSNVFKLFAQKQTTPIVVSNGAGKWIQCFCSGTIGSFSKDFCHR
jgi:hypothetical protein